MNYNNWLNYHRSIRLIHFVHKIKFSCDIPNWVKIRNREVNQMLKWG